MEFLVVEKGWLGNVCEDGGEVLKVQNGAQEWLVLCGRIWAGTEEEGNAVSSWADV